MRYGELPALRNNRNLRSDEAAAQPSLSIVNKEDNATCQGNDETAAQIPLPAASKDDNAASQDDDNETHLYDTLPKDVSAQDAHTHAAVHIAS
ncbi:hypothetical protein K492DRAFT_196931 [Lichtheimia hyalospora FSU 10163]|nr:hypothetical protein K492DRAFT_196931 [Lichtheimia hyalospora FSU 10163]